jgi:hypothetical protein
MNLLDVVEQGHEAEIHVELLVAVKQREAGIVGDEVEFDFLVSAQHHHVFHHARCRQSGQAGRFEAVTMEVNGMNVIAGVARGSEKAKGRRL